MTDITQKIEQMESLSARRYSIIKSRRESRRTLETVIDSGLDWGAADAKRDKLTQAEIAANPLKSSWTRDIYVIRLETDKSKTDQIAALK